MNKMSIRPMRPEDWPAVSQIYTEGIATEHATFQTECPPYTAWDAAHIKACRLVVLDGEEIAGWAVLSTVNKRWCYRGVAEVSIYVGEAHRGKGYGYFLLHALCEASEKAGYWTLQSTVLQDNEASRRLHLKCGFREVGRRERIARDCHGRWLDTLLMERRCAANEPEGYHKL
jgi:phosphinothricin acetyltransferase